MSNLALPMLVVSDEPGAARALVCNATPRLTCPVNLHGDIFGRIASHAGRPLTAQ